MLVRSLSFASMGCLGIDRDVVPFSYLLRFADRVVNLRLPGLYDVIGDDGLMKNDGEEQMENGSVQEQASNGNVKEQARNTNTQQQTTINPLTPQYSTVMEGSLKGSLLSANSPFLGHVLCQVAEKTITIQRMDRGPLSTIFLAGVDVGDHKQSSASVQGSNELDTSVQGSNELDTNMQGSNERPDTSVQGSNRTSSANPQGKNAPSANLHEDNKSSTTSPNPLDSLLEEMRANATDLVSRYNEQLNASANNDDHVDHSVLSRILKEYMVGFPPTLDSRRRGSPRFIR